MKEATYRSVTSLYQHHIIVAVALLAMFKFIIKRELPR